MFSAFSIQPAARLALICLPCLFAAACSSGPAGDSVLSKPSSFFATPDWMRDRVVREGSLSGRIAPEDFAGADGRCAGSGIAVPAAGPEEGEVTPKPEAPPAMTAGVGLGMSECEVISRAGQADDFQLGTSERGERALTLTYLRGSRPGIYRFHSGRMVSIERGPAPPEPPKVAKPKPKPAAPRAAAVARPQPAAQPQSSPSASWPAPRPAAQQPASQPQQAPWPQPGRQVAPQQSAPQSGPWPSSQPAQQSSPWPAR